MRAATSESASCITWIRQLVRCQDQREVPSNAVLKSRLLGIYFSASWSPPCRDFTALLADAYRIIRNRHGEQAFEVVLVPLDTSEAEWQRYISDMPWLSVPVSGREAVLRLFLHFNISEVPRLIIVDATGEVINANARGGQGIGFGCDPLAAYDRFCEGLRHVQGSRGRLSKLDSG